MRTGEVTKTDDNKVIDSLVNTVRKTDLKLPKTDVKKEKSTIKRFRRCLKDDVIFRKKFIIFLCICFNFFVLGINVGMFGPTLLDLKLITNTSLDKVSFLFNAITIGYLPSSLIVGFLFDRYNKLLMIFVSIVCLSMVVAVLPWCSIYELMVAIHVLKGLCMGVTDGVGNALVMHLLFDGVKTYVQIAHFMFAFGGILAPILSAPFLSTELSNNQNSSAQELSNITLAYVSPSVFYETQTAISITNISRHILTTDTTGIKSEIYKGYTICAVLTLLSAVPFLVVYYKSDENACPTTKKDGTKETTETISLRLKALSLVILCIIIASYTALEDTYAGFLTTFTVKHFNWSKSEGAFATSVFWTFFAVGRFFGIFIVNFVGQVKLLFIYTVTIIAAFICLLVTALYQIDTGVWVSSIVVGFGMSIFFPIFFSWTESKFFHVDGKVTSLIMGCASIGVIINPIILARVMNTASIWFAYVLTGESILVLIVFSIAVYIASLVKKERSDTNEIVIQVEMEFIKD